MPLIKSSSKKAFGANVAELIRSWKEKGSIGTSGKLTKAQARKRALAIAFSVKRES